MAFEITNRLASLMRGFPRPWYIAGGWAIDLFLGRETRAHEDVEVAVLRADQEEVRHHLAGWTFEKVVDRVREPWREEEQLEPPVHEIHARSPGGETLEILLNEAVGELWRFRRNLDVARPLVEIGLRSVDGIPFLVPEVVLLYKAKAPRPRDEQDLAAVLPRLDAGRRGWLLRALEACHPGHPWIAQLRAPATS